MQHNHVARGSTQRIRKTARNYSDIQRRQLALYQAAKHIRKVQQALEEYQRLPYFYQSISLAPDVEPGATALSLLSQPT